MKIQRIYTLIFLTIVITLGVSVWVILQSIRTEPIKTYVATPLEESNVNKTTEAFETTTQMSEFTPVSELTPEERALKAKDTFLAALEFVGVDTENDSYWKLLHEAVNSPEYIEYQKNRMNG